MVRARCSRNAARRGSVRPSSVRATVSPPLVMVGLLIVVLGFLLRLRFLNYPMRYDESFNYMTFGMKTPWYIVSHYVASNNHILHTLQMRMSVFLFGNTPAALRLPALVAGMLLIPASGWLAWALFGHRLSTAVTMLAVASSSYLVEYSCNARGYSLLTLTFTLATVCTVYLFRTPQRRRLWLAWGTLCALGAFAHPAMLLGAAGLTAALSVRLFLLPSGDPLRRDGVLGLMMGLASCFALGLILYAPALLITGPIGCYRLLSSGSGVHAAFLREHGGMLQTTWDAWTRHTPLAWQALIIAGCAGFAGTAWRKRSRVFLVPLCVLIGLPALARLSGLAVTPPAWTFALPLALACALYGLFQWAELLPGNPLNTRASYGLLALASLAGIGCAFNVSRQSYLSAWEHELVDVERILDDCREFGMSRCALLMRYTPATSYYMLRKRMAPTPAADADDVERVYIVADTLKSVDDLWNPTVPGFDRFRAPELSKHLSRADVFIAYRKDGDYDGDPTDRPPSLVTRRMSHSWPAPEETGGDHSGGAKGSRP